ncbi:helix-turn-helix domain-containing protein [Micromonospora okii]|uniref:helix-turn-helix domain-containing protein n=1 Tax=Micromonospora okii TaxID=1182970 RepID=UPI001E403311|nr:helix-turn-helix transcriptional regulator [Micromonospora okii]
MSAYLALVLKHERGKRGLTQDQVAEAVHVSGSLIAMFETGRRVPQPDTARRLDELLGTGDLFARMAVEARRDAQPGWFRPWAEVEREATSLRCFEPVIIPGLLQTEGYARAALASGLFVPEKVEEHVAFRMERQALLDRKEPPLTIFVIDEAALRRGEPAVLKEQLLHLAEVGLRTRVLVHVVPCDAGPYIGQSGPFTLAEAAGGEHLAFLEDQLEGRVLADPKRVSTLVRAWEAVRAVALPRDQSRDLILKQVNEL